MMNDIQTLVKKVEVILNNKFNIKINNTEKEILINLLTTNKKYEKIALDVNCSIGHVKTTSSRLFKKIAKLLDVEKVTKKNIQRLLREYFNDHLELSTSLNISCENFTRTKEIQAIDEALDVDYKTIFLLGESGIGKTVLSRQYLELYQYPVFRIDMPYDQDRIESAEDLIRSCLEDFNIQSGVQNLSSALKLLRKLISTQKIVIVIDNLETIIEAGKITPKHRDYLELLRVLSDSSNRGFALITSSETLREQQLENTYYIDIKGLDFFSWNQFFSKLINRNKNHHQQIESLKKLHTFYRGNPRAMELLRVEIQNRGYHSDIFSFWENNKNFLPNFFTQTERQIAKLKNEFELAYKVLLRMSALHPQSGKRLSKRELLQLFHEGKENDLAQILFYLNDIFLIDHYKGQYKIKHPSSHSLVKQSLKKSSEWKSTHRAFSKIHQFDLLNASSSKQIVISVSELLYHLFSAEDFDDAWSILCSPAIPAYPEELFLHFLSWGYIRKVLQWAEELSTKISHDKISSLYRCLGDCHIYLVDDGFKVALNWHQKARNSAIKIGDKWTEFNSYSDAGLCYLIAGEYESSLSSYKEKLNLCENIQDINNLEHSKSKHISNRKFSIYCEIALLESYLGKSNQTIRALKTVGEYLKDPSIYNVPPWQICWDLNMAGLARKQIGHYDLAKELIKSAMKLSHQYKFQTDFARSQYILGDIYREIGQLEESAMLQKKAVQYFTDIGAKYEIAVSNYYAGLTCKAQGLDDQAYEYAEVALLMFESMQTPKQIQKIKEFLA